MNVKRKIIFSAVILIVLILIAFILYFFGKNTSKVVNENPDNLHTALDIIGASTQDLSIGDSEISIGDSTPIVTTTVTTTATTLAPVTTTTNTSATTTSVTTTDEYVVDYDNIERASLDNEDMSEDVYADPDIRGWVYIPNTNINYPFTQADDNQYYLTHDIYGRQDGYGAIFMDWKNYFDDFGQQSDLLTLYGHNMADGSMFSNLKKYRDNYSFYDTNPIVEIYSSYSVDYYKIFAMLIVNGNGGSDFEFWKYNDLSDPDVFNFYVDTSRNKSLIDTAVDVQYGDKLLALVTCNSGSYSNNDRFMVVARKLRDGEDLYDGCYRTR